LTQYIAHADAAAHDECDLHLLKSEPGEGLSFALRAADHV